MMGMTLAMVPAMQQTMSPAMRQQMKMMHKLAMELRSPALPNAARGLEGIAIEHRTLQERNAIGVLIGGVAESVWNRERTNEELRRHKDIDVLVTSWDRDFESFAEGIDWWPFKAEKMDVVNSTGGTNLNVEVQWHENFNNVILRFIGETRDTLEAGLYIPSPEWITQMRGMEMEASIDPNVGIEGDALDRYMGRVAARMRKTLMPPLKDMLPGFVLAHPYESDEQRIKNFSVRGQLWEHLRALRDKEVLSKAEQ